MSSNPGAPWARFDDLRAGEAQLFGAPSRVLVAEHPDEVPAVLAEVDRATREGAWAYGFVAYEAAAALDPGLPVHPPAEGLPLAWFGLCDGPTPVPVVAPTSARTYSAGPWTSAWTPQRHHDAVASVRAAIAAGDTYQCNLTTRMTSAVHGDLTGLYADLALGQRGEHNAFLDLGRFVIASASPELFFRVEGDRLHMRPMKGTAPRGRFRVEDDRLGDALRASEKDRAENVMIVDLVRNDAARLAETGTVVVGELCRLERYETVQQLTSEVTARLRPEVGLVELFRALFPCGSVTGAPKARTMELIRDLEDSSRGVYCGAVGVVAPPDAPVRARFAVGIRTVVVDRSTGTGVYGTGGGITWGSEPAAEYAELLAKAAVLGSRPEDFHLLETMRHEPGAGVVGLDRHLGRLADSAAYFGFSFDAAATRDALGAALGAGTDAGALVRLRAFRDGRVEVECAELPAPPGRPVLLAVDDDPVDSRRCWPHHKTSLREPYAGRMRRHPDADDVVLVNERGEVTETTIANLAVRLDGVWCTPPFGDGCLPGIERARLLDDGRLTERVLWPADLRRATGLALVSSVRGWRPAVLAEHEAAASRRER